MVLLAVYLLLSISWSFTQNSSLADGFMTITKLFLSQNIRNVNHLSQKMMFLCGCFFIVHFTLLFASQLFVLLMDPFLTFPKITTLEELANMPVNFSYGEYVDEVLQQSDLRVLKRLKAKISSIGLMNVDEMQDFLANSLNTTQLVFSMDRIILDYFVKNVETVDVHPVSVSFSSALVSVP